MSEPCQQINRLESVDEKLDRLTEILTTVAVQKKEIEHIVEALNDFKSWLKLLEGRMQTQEKSAGTSAAKFVWILATTMLSSAIGAVATIVILAVTK